MCDDGEWGGNLELQALSNSLDINFIIHLKKRSAMLITSANDKKDRKE